MIKPGIELDTLIAEKVMGWKKCILQEPYRGLTWMWSHKEGYSIKDAQTVPPYSTDIHAAWEIVNKMKEVGNTISFSSRKNDMDGHHITIGYYANPLNSFHTFVEASGDTPEHAICLAVLKTV